MNWDALGAMGEIAGAIAVIATLFFLARQSQVNTRELERTNEYQRSTTLVTGNEIFNSVFRPIMQDSELAEIYLKGTKGKPLSESEEVRYCIFVSTFLSLMEGGSESLKSGFTFEDYEAGYQAVFDQINPFLVKLFNHPAAKTWLEEEAPALFTKEFMDVFHEYGPLMH